MSVQPSSRCEAHVCMCSRHGVIIIGSQCGGGCLLCAEAIAPYAERNPCPRTRFPTLQMP